MFVETISTEYGAMLIHKFDTVQTKPLRDTGKSISYREIDLLKPYINSETVFVDVGSNIGCFSLAYARTAKKVIAFEAQRMFAYMLSGSVALNGLQTVRVYNAAISDCSGTLAIPQFDLNSQLSWGSIEFSNLQVEKLNQERQPDNPADFVSSYALDDLIHYATVLKIDVEGMELKVLNGAVSLITRCKPVLFVEHYKADKSALRQWFDSYGYTYEDVGTDYLGLPCQG